MVGVTTKNDAVRRGVGARHPGSFGGWREQVGEQRVSRRGRPRAAVGRARPAADRIRI
jgi:hypothetical protein